MKGLHNIHVSSERQLCGVAVAVIVKNTRISTTGHVKSLFTMFPPIVVNQKRSFFLWLYFSESMTRWFLQMSSIMMLNRDPPFSKPSHVQTYVPCTTPELATTIFSKQAWSTLPWSFLCNDESKTNPLWSPVFLKAFTVWSQNFFRHSSNKCFRSSFSWFYNSSFTYVRSARNSDSNKVSALLIFAIPLWFFQRMPVILTIFGVTGYNATIYTSICYP